MSAIRMAVLLYIFAVYTALGCIQGQSCDYRQYIQPGSVYYIHSDGNPGQGYRAGSSCKWEARTDWDARIILDCQYVDIPLDYYGNCIDALIVANEAAASGKVYCGNDSFTIESIGSSMIVKFISRFWSPGGRFSCSIGSKKIDTMSNLIPDNSGNNCDCGWSYKPRIVGGEETAINEFPFMAGIVSATMRIIICGATIISKRHVVTAAHCVVNQDYRSTGVIVGEHDVSTGSETNASQLKRVKQFIVHPNYSNSTSNNDIALVVIHGFLEYSMRIGPACLPFVAQDEVGKRVTALGWGTTEFGGPASERLLKVMLALIRVARCESVYGPKFDPETQICAFAQGKDTCQFDSGGPLVWNDPRVGRYYLLGVISYGKACASEDPSVNTKVFTYMKWIVGETPGEQYCMK